MKDKNFDNIHSFEDLPYWIRLMTCAVWFCLLAFCFSDAGMLVLIPAMAGMAFCLKKEIEQGHW